MSDESLCYGVPKPKFPPSYYATHNITPSPGNDWICRTSGWEWQQTAEEKVETAVAEKKSEDKPYTRATRDMYSRIVVDGVRYHVYTDSEGRDYFQRGDDLCYLLTTWWKTYEARQHGEKMIKKCVPWKTSDVGVFETGRVWDPVKGEEVEHKPGIKLPDAPKLPKIPDPGDWIKSLQIIAVVVMLFIIAIVYIIFVKGKGASGVTVGGVG